MSEPTAEELLQQAADCIVDLNQRTPPARAGRIARQLVHTIRSRKAMAQAAEVKAHAARRATQRADAKAAAREAEKAAASKTPIIPLPPPAPSERRPSDWADELGEIDRAKGHETEHVLKSKPPAKKRARKPAAKKK